MTNHAQGKALTEESFSGEALIEDSFSGKALIEESCSDPLVGVKLNWRMQIENLKEGTIKHSTV